MERNVRDNNQASKKKLQIPVLAVRSEGFTGKEVKTQMERVAQKLPIENSNLDISWLRNAPSHWQKHI
jgi:hypothetical protein